MSDAIKSIEVDGFTVQENGIVRAAGAGRILFNLIEAAESVNILQRIASISHNGALIGFDDQLTALTEIRRITLPYFDKTEATRVSTGIAIWEATRKDAFLAELDTDAKKIHNRY